MAKDTYFFPHDYHARHDPKLQLLLMEHGLAGIGAYWCIVEILYENGGICRKCDTRAIAFGLHCDEELIVSVLENFDLFDKTEEGDYFSPSADERNAQRAKIAEMRSRAGRKGNEVRWGNHKVANATKNIANATVVNRKTSLGKERKGNNIKNKENIKEKEIDLSFVSDDSYRPIVSDWLEYKAARREKYKDARSLAAMYKKLVGFSGGDPAVARQIIDYSMAMNYSGFFEPKNNKNGLYTGGTDSACHLDDREREYPSTI